MGYGGCVAATSVITGVLASAEGGRRARGLVAAGATPEQFVRGMIDLASADVRELILFETSVPGTDLISVPVERIRALMSRSIRDEG